MPLLPRFHRVTAAFSILFLLCSLPAWARRHRAKRATADVEASPAADASESQKVAWVTIDRIDGNTIYFKAPEGTTAPKPLQLDLYDMKALGTLRPVENGQPYFVISGRPCKDCLQDSGLYVIRSAPGKPIAFVYPGRILEPKSRALALDSRAFFGHCLRGRANDVLVIFQSEKVDKRHGMQSSVLVAEPIVEQGGEGPATLVNHLREQLIERHLPKIRDTLRLAKARSCMEVEPRNRVMLSRPLDINLRRQKADDDDEDDDSPKENESDRDISPSGD